MNLRSRVFRWASSVLPMSVVARMAPRRIAFYGHVASNDPGLIMRNRYRYPSLDELVEFVSEIRSVGYQFVSIPEFRDASSGKCALLTFDDGFMEVEKEVWPCLQRLSVPFALFVLGKPLQDETFVTEELKPFAEKGRKYFLGKAEIAKLAAAGVFIGYHSCTHVRFPSEVMDTLLWPAEAVCPDDLASVLSRPLTFSYPFVAPDRFDAIDAGLSKLSYEMFFDTQGLGHQGNHYYRIPLDVAPDWSGKSNPALSNFKFHCLRGAIRTWAGRSRTQEPTKS